MLKQILLVVFILFIFSGLMFKLPKNSNLEEYNFMNDYLYFQSKAFYKRSDISYLDDISFNEFGNVNKARTLLIKEKVIVIRIGNGSIKKK